MRRPRRRAAGFTLVEMLVVLAIVAITAGIVVIGMGGGGDRAVEREARRLAARLTLAADERMVTDAAIGFAWDARGYRFPGEAKVSALEPHALADGVTLAGAGTVAIGAPLDLRVSDGKAAWVVRFDGATARAEPGR